MNFGFTEEQELLRDQVRRFMQDACPLTEVRKLMKSATGTSPSSWRQAAELGWLGLIIPEGFGGIGLKWVDLTVVLEETGRGLCPLPIISDVEQADGGTHRGVLGHDAGVLDGHVPSAEVGGLGTCRGVAGVERRGLQHGVGHGQTVVRKPAGVALARPIRCPHDAHAHRPHRSRRLQAGRLRHRRPRRRARPRTGQEGRGDRPGTHRGGPHQARRGLHRRGCRGQVRRGDADPRRQRDQGAHRRRPGPRRRR